MVAPMSIYSKKNPEYPRSLWKTPANRLQWGIANLMEFMQSPEVLKLLKTWSRQVDLSTWKPGNKAFETALKDQIENASRNGTSPFAKSAWKAHQLAHELRHNNHQYGAPYASVKFDEISILLLKNILTDVHTNKDKSWLNQAIELSEQPSSEPHKTSSRQSRSRKTTQMTTGMTGSTEVPEDTLSSGHGEL
jgi:hypothetical protein